MSETAIKIKKEYKLCEVRETTINDATHLRLQSDRYVGGYRGNGREDYGTFESKESAYEAAYNLRKYSEWVVLEVVSFDV